MARKTSKTRGSAPPPPRLEHPYLVGHSHAEAKLVQRAAKAMGVGPVTFLRDAGQSAARDVLGLPWESEQ